MRGVLELAKDLATEDRSLTLALDLEDVEADGLGQRAISPCTGAAVSKDA